LGESTSSLDNKRIVSIKNYWRWNLLTNHVEFSDEWAHSLGYEKHELTPHVDTWKSLVHPEDMPKVWKVLEPHLKGETKNYKCRNRLKMKNGIYRWNLDHGTVTSRSGCGQPLIMEGYDIAC
jgi:PAS domain-containing protein